MPMSPNVSERPDDKRKRMQPKEIPLRRQMVKTATDRYLLPEGGPKEQTPLRVF